MFNSWRSLSLFSLKENFTIASLWYVMILKTVYQMSEFYVFMYKNASYSVM